MVVSIRDIFKLIGVILVCFCAVFVCAIFINYGIDLKAVESEIAETSRTYYDASMLTCKAVCGVSGAVLALTSVVLLCFYISHYIESHSRDLGILKAMGYSRIKIASGFAVFGLSVLLGTSLGYAGSHLMMPKIYEVQNKDGLLPDFGVRFHPELIFFVIVIPAVVFAGIAVAYSYKKLKKPAMDLLRERNITKIKISKNEKEMPFLNEMRRNTLRQKKSLVFFIAFAIFCFSAMIQMAASMDEYASRVMSSMILIIGVILAYVILFIATSSVIRGNAKSIMMMKVMGYDAKECANAVFGGYRLWALLGFFAGTLYQYGILKVMVDVVFKDMDNVEPYRFKPVPMLISLAVYVISYEATMYFYRKRVDKMPVKQIMIE
ncbi:MAG: ABC transporter permease [Butyrivibrio sp.]|nr:ABC transporter permease [Butyrivibrio sp.]